MLTVGLLSGCYGDDDLGRSAGGNAVEFGVVVDEPQVLALGCGVGAFHVAIVHLHPLLASGNVRMVFSPPIISFKQPWC